jgi:hypothetical protein
VTPDESAELGIRFTYHAPRVDQIAKYQQLRHAAHEAAMTIYELCPDSRERSLAITHLEEVVMWANAAIARRS